VGSGSSGNAEDPDAGTAPGAEPAGEQLTPCKQCRQPISTKARLCRHCHSFQDWRGYLSLSSTVLALFVALVSVASIAVPPMVSLLRGQRSAVRISNPVVRGEAIYITASNLGNSAGVIERASLSIIGGPYGIRPQLRNPAEGFVPPGSRQVGFDIGFNLSSDEAINVAFPMMAGPIRSRRTAGALVVHVRQADGEQERFELPITGIMIADALFAHSNRCRQERNPSYENGCWGLREVRAESDRLHAEVVSEGRGGRSRSTPPAASHPGR